MYLFSFVLWCENRSKKEFRYYFRRLTWWHPAQLVDQLCVEFEREVNQMSKDIPIKPKWVGFSLKKKRGHFT